MGKANPGRGWIMVKAPYLTAETIVRAIESGDYYCTSGVVLKDVRYSGKDFSLMIQGEQDVTYRTQFIATMKDAPLKGEPIVHGKGNVIDVTRRYSDAIGKVVAESTSLTPSYRLTGDEWYVRARVISSKGHLNRIRKAIWRWPGRNRCCRDPDIHMHLRLCTDGERSVSLAGVVLAVQASQSQIQDAPIWGTNEGIQSWRRSKQKNSFNTLPRMANPWQRRIIIAI